jgi:hypothetical protein
MSIIANSVTRLDDDHIQMGYRGRVFGARVSTEDVAVDPTDGTVRAYDDAAECWTTCHSITARGLRAIRAAAGC